MDGIKLAIDTFAEKHGYTKTETGNKSGKHSHSFMGGKIAGLEALLLKMGFQPVKPNVSGIKREYHLNTRTAEYYIEVDSNGNFYTMFIPKAGGFIKKIFKGLTDE